MLRAPQPGALMLTARVQGLPPASVRVPVVRGAPRDVIPGVR
jgi:hypothetical protein